MGLLKENENTTNQVKIELANALSELEQIEEAKAFKLASWIAKKCKHHKRIYNKKFNKIPKDLKRGDIIRVEFGINIGEELSDDSTDGHFAMVWAQQGFTFLVLPFTKKEQKTNPYSVNIGIIEGLPITTDTYVKLDYMKWIYSTRIKWINEKEDGKIVIEDEKNPDKLKDIVTSIKRKMSKVLINN